MKQKNWIIGSAIVLLALVVGAFYGSRYGFSLRGPLSNSGLVTQASLASPHYCAPGQTQRVVGLVARPNGEVQLKVYCDRSVVWIDLDWAEM